jgi:hypothetical protein
MRNLPECFFYMSRPPIIDFKDSVQLSLVSVIDFTNPQFLTVI